jgi:hypothetical protein
MAEGDRYQNQPKIELNDATVKINGNRREGESIQLEG